MGNPVLSLIFHPWNDDNCHISGWTAPNISWDQLVFGPGICAEECSSAALKQRPRPRQRGSEKRVGIGEPAMGETKYLRHLVFPIEGERLTLWRPNMTWETCIFVQERENHIEKIW